ncbi:hypothetical protein RVR_1177 [Actinacidiphila reveromycinica]|uniref:Uncharacterized protein n=1 Tax=Actinacidiphila reveromycinica TaxID=659352 RepID=A0A7U3UNZ3_9ACTN|nr:hypothetical protein [Streptomyces sp. SN-593]BBA96051.1 hypothetical protein RVR_1177 [Streptomyces sp. SN-593]
MSTPLYPTRRPVGTLRLTDRVPFIASWSAETATQPDVTMRRGRLAYRDERPWDRDSNGVLWRRVPSMPGKGRPEYGKVHLLRQRLAMDALLCQVCGQPAQHGSTADGLLWLLGEDPDDLTTWPAEMVTGHPPVCLSCAWLSVRACPHLRKQYAAVRARRFSLSGVHGVLYRPSHPAPVPHDVGGLDFGDDRMPWMQAAQLMMRLDEFTLVDLETEYRSHTGSGALPR